MVWQAPFNQPNALLGTYINSPVYRDRRDLPQPESVMGSSLAAITPPSPLPFRFHLEEEDQVQILFSSQRKMATLLAFSPQTTAFPAILDATPDDGPVWARKEFPTLEETFLQRERAASFASQTFVGEQGFPPSIAGTAYSDFSCNILSEIQRHMLETTIDDGATWSLWTEAEVLKYFNDRLKRFYIETGVIRSRQLVSASSRTISLPSDVMEVRRVIWWSSSNVPSPLTREDKWVLNNGYPDWRTASGTPIAYVEEPNPTRSVILYPYESGGQLEICYVPYPPVIGSGCQPMPIPAIFSHVIKYGIMADMFAKEGEANDADRSRLCEQRWENGIQLARLFIGRWSSGDNGNG